MIWGWRFATCADQGCRGYVSEFNKPVSTISTPTTRDEARECIGALVVVRSVPAANSCSCTIVVVLAPTTEPPVPTPLAVARVVGGAVPPSLTDAVDGTFAFAVVNRDVVKPVVITADGDDVVVGVVVGVVVVVVFVVVVALVVVVVVAFVVVDLVGHPLPLSSVFEMR
jgi:hypothetical protein